MIVEELIKILQQLPSEARVVNRGLSTCYADIDRVVTREMGEYEVYYNTRNISGVNVGDILIELE